jgi:hypothetical protein
MSDELEIFVTYPKMIFTNSILDDNFEWKAKRLASFCEDAQRKLKQKLKSEYGTTQAVRFIDTSNVKMFDKDNKEIPIPKCEKCGAFKTYISGKDAFTWICCECPI